MLLAVASAGCAGGATGSSTLPVTLPTQPSTAPSQAPVAPGSTPTPIATSTPAATAAPTSSSVPTATPVAVPTPPLANAQLRVPQGFVANVVATVGGARELAALPNGDLIVGTGGTSIAIVPNADGPGVAGASATFATLPEGPAQGVAFGNGFVFVATQYHVYRIAYTSGARSGTASAIAAIRTASVAPNSDGDVHKTSSVAVSGSTLFVGVGSSCNACVESDPTRATVQKMGLDGSAPATQATRIRNPIALATDPSSGNLWAGVAGQDNLPAGHPYDFIDPVSTHTAPADYGWPACEENHVAYTSGANCASTIAPAIIFPAYSTLIGATFYPAAQGGTYAFPAAWSGGLFVSMHGSWHRSGGVDIVPPHVAFVPFSGAAPARGVTWSDPTAQWNDFFTGFQSASGARIGRATGVAVGPNGSLFVADDGSGSIYRIRPLGSGSSSVKRAAR